MALSDKNAIMNIIGCLIQKPLLFSEIGNELNVDDFDTKFTKSIYNAIYNLFQLGAEKITIVDIDTYLQQFSAIYTNFTTENGIGYLQDCCDIAQPENFYYYFTRVKKFSLLRKLIKNGIGIKDIYPENDIDLKRQKDMLEAFDNMSIQDMFDIVNKRLTSIEYDFNIGKVQSVAADEHIKDLKEELKKLPEVGAPLQGDIFNVIARGARKGKFYLYSGGSGAGKALPNSTIIPTPSGDRKVGDIKIGDYLFDAFGKPTKVVDVFPQGEKEVYQITFKDGRTAKCCDEHLWSYYKSTQKKMSILNRKFYTSTLREINSCSLQGQKGEFIYSIPLSYPVEYNTTYPVIPAYIFGLILGDGSFRQSDSSKSFYYSSKDDYLPNIIGQTMGWKVEKNKGENYTYSFSYKEQQKSHPKVWVEDILINHEDLLNKYSEEKYIPDEYLYGDINQRTELLKGLLDTDGTVDTKGRIRYFTTSKKLSQQVTQLCYSLGLKATVSIDLHKGNTICYNLNISGKPEVKIKLFNLPRKRKNIDNWYNNVKRKESNETLPIIKIEDLGYKAEMTCFLVDNSEHLFLTENYIVTHNSRRLIGDACMLAYPFRYEEATSSWIKTGSEEKTLIITTELEKDEVQTIVLAYLSGVNEEKILTGTYTLEEEQRVDDAIDLMEAHPNLFIESIPDPSIAQLKTVARKHITMNKVENIIYDYIFSTPNLINEFKDSKLREDVVLTMLSTALKDIAVENNIFVESGTQLSGNFEEFEGIRNQTLLRGSKGIAD